MTGTWRRTPSGVRAGGQCLPEGGPFFSIEAYAFRTQVSSFFSIQLNYELFLVTAVILLHFLVVWQSLPRAHCPASPIGLRHEGSCGRMDGSLLTA